MPSARQGSIRLFQFAGVNVFLHWSWFVVAVFEVRGGIGHYSAQSWNLLEYLSIFLIVLLHEFGHALACKQVGGLANQIVLWPLGGVAYVDPPPRPGAVLWSITAGPLVNVALLPILFVLQLVAHSLDWRPVPDIYRLLAAVSAINTGLLKFNILPIYPLDGGQILQALLWFVLGRARSLMVVTLLGFIGVVGFIAWAFFAQSTWIAVIAVFLLLNCWGGLQHARMLARLAKLPRHVGFACPTCKNAPPVGEFWKCDQCGQPFDTFQAHAICPHCGAQHPATACLDCHRVHPLQQWIVSA